MKKNKALWLSMGAVIVLVWGAVFVITGMRSSGFFMVTVGAVWGALLTVVVYLFLDKRFKLRHESSDRQSGQDEKREKQAKIFEKKQETYHAFLEKLRKIIQNGEIKVGVKTEDKNSGKMIDELRDFIFQLGYLQLYASEATIDGVSDGITSMIQILNDVHSGEKNRPVDLPNFYASLSRELFKIIAVLKADLHGKDTATITKDKMNDIFRECDLALDDKDFDSNEVQQYFWKELMEQLRLKDYIIEEKDFTRDVCDFYAASARNRHRGYGFTFDTGYKTIPFRVEMGNEYFYGFPRKEEGTAEVSNSQMKQWIHQTSKEFTSNSQWLGYRVPYYRHRLDFWKLNSVGFDSLKDLRKRQRYVKEIAQEIDSCIKEFIENAKNSEKTKIA
ncbi:MAG: hypothetical protein LBK94_04060 [Prevotellaceae bacterium]|jgi:hypothetical protein|nr:hypothetical protein [Prevotellaceae bacterium]